MSKRSTFEGLRDEIFADVPHSTLVSDDALRLKYARDAARSLEKLVQERPHVSDVRSLSPEDFAEAMAPHFRDAAFAQFQMNAGLSEDIGQLGRGISAGLDDLKGVNREGFKRVSDRVGSLAEDFKQGLVGVRQEVQDAARNVGSAVTGVGFDYLRRRRSVDISVTGNRLAEVTCLWINRLVGHENFEQAMEWGSIPGVDKLMLKKLINGGSLPEDASEEEVAAKTFYDQVKGLSFGELLEQGFLSRESLQVFNDAGLFEPKIQSRLYRSGIVQPPSWSLAATNIGVSRVAKGVEVGIAQRAAMLREQSVSNHHLAGIHETMQGVGVNVQGMRWDIQGMRTDVRGLRGAVETGFGTLNDTALRSEAYLAAASGSLNEIVGGIDGLQEIALDLSFGVANLDGTMRRGFDGVQALLAESVRVNMAAAESVAYQLQHEGDRQAAYMEALITASFRTADDVLKTLDMARGDLADLKQIGLGSLQAQVRAVHELHGLRQEQRVAFEALIGLGQESNQILREMAGTMRDVLREVQVAPSVREYTEALRRAKTAFSKGDFTLAITLVDAAIMHDPTKASAYFLKARVLLKVDKLKEAKQCLGRAIKYAESPLEKAHYSLFVALCEADDRPEGAVKILEHASRLNPTVQIVLIRALMLFKTDKREECYASLRDVIASDGRVILELVHNELFREIREELLDEVLFPIIEEEGSVDVKTLYYVTQMIEEVESESYPPDNLKYRLRERWKSLVKLQLKLDPLQLVVDPYLSGIMSTASTLLFEEIVNEILQEEQLPEYKTSMDYFYFASLMFVGGEPSESNLRRVLFKALSKDERSSHPAQFPGLMDDIARFAKERSYLFFETIAMTAGSDYRAFKNYLYQRING